MEQELSTHKSRKKAKATGPKECLQISMYPDDVFKINFFKFTARNVKNMKNSKIKTNPKETIIYKNYIEGAKDIRKTILKNIENKFQKVPSNNNSLVNLSHNITQNDILNIVNDVIKNPNQPKEETIK